MFCILHYYQFIKFELKVFDSNWNLVHMFWNLHIVKYCTLNLKFKFSGNLKYSISGQDGCVHDGLSVSHFLRWNGLSELTFICAPYTFGLWCHTVLNIFPNFFKNLLSMHCGSHLEAGHHQHADNIQHIASLWLVWILLSLVWWHVRIIAICPMLNCLWRLLGSFNWPQCNGMVA